MTLYTVNIIMIRFHNEHCLQVQVFDISNLTHDSSNQIIYCDFDKESRTLPFYSIYVAKPFVRRCVLDVSLKMYVEFLLQQFSTYHFAVFEFLNKLKNEIVDTFILKLNKSFQWQIQSKKYNVKLVE